MKITELAKELKISKIDLFRMARTKGIRIKPKATKIDPQTTSKIRHLFNQQAAQKARTEEAASEEKKEFTLTSEIIKLKDFCTLIETDAKTLLTVVLQKGLTLNLNSDITHEIATELALELNIIIHTKITQEAEEKDAMRKSIEKIEEDELNQHIDHLIERPPVITIMGHVDHGKTQLLDTIRKANVVAKEAGGITQHIGAYQVTVNDKRITFLDTPGHEAFTSLRARGAQITDIAILVVAADEGIKPQTIEAINHAKAAQVPIIVAINKIDKPEAQPETVKQELTKHELVSEEWGGSTIMIECSAKTGKGVPELLEMIALQAEMLELRAFPDGPAKGIVIESRLSKQKGPMATLLIKSGNLKIGSLLLTGAISGKVRALINDQGQSIKEAGPGCPVEILGLEKVPQPGEIVENFETDKELKKILQERIMLKKSEKSKQLKGISLESLSQQVESGDVKTINLIIKADVHGSLEAIIASLKKIETNEVTINIIHAATGPINANDVMLAQASKGIIFGFSVNANTEAKKLAEKSKTTIKTYKIIYEILDDFKKALSGLFKPEFEEVEIGKAEVRQLFKFSKVGVIAGSYVIEGKIKRNAIASLIRDGKEIYKGKIETLKRFKDDVKEVASDYECGIVLEKHPTIQEKDIIVAYTIQEKNKI